MAILGEIRPLAMDENLPAGWAKCDGRILSIAENRNLFNIIGNIYGGDGINNFALPDFQGRIPIHKGKGQNLTKRKVGEKIGKEMVQLTEDTIPAHNHLLKASRLDGDKLTPKDNYPAVTKYKNYYNTNPGVYKKMNDRAVTTSGSSRSHNNLMPFLVLNYIICTEGENPKV